VADIQLTCINKMPRDNPHEGITHVGSGSAKWARSEVIVWIERRIHTYYTHVGGMRADVRVVIGPNGKYLRTYANGIWNDNLLALPDCP
jgi:hypothetical protein